MSYTKSPTTNQGDCLMKNVFKILFIALVCLSASCSLASPNRPIHAIYGGGGQPIFIRSDIDIQYIILINRYPLKPIHEVYDSAILCVDLETGKPFPISWDIYVDGTLLTTLNNTSSFYTKDYFDIFKTRTVEIIPTLPTSPEGHFYYISCVFVYPIPYTPGQ